MALAISFTVMLNILCIMAIADESGDEKEKAHTVTFDSWYAIDTESLGSLTILDQGTEVIEVNDNELLPMSITIPAISTPYDFFFMGYYSQPSYRGVWNEQHLYYNADGVRTTSAKVTEDITLYARWSTPNGGTHVDYKYSNNYGGTRYVSYIYGMKLPVRIIPPTREGYTFTGLYTWAGTSQIGEQIYDNVGKRVFEKELSDEVRLEIGLLYAHWERIYLDITLDGANEEQTTETLSIGYGDSFSEDVTPPTRIGYTFAGYYDMPNGRGLKYFDEIGVPSGIFRIISDITLYAHWTANDYTVTFNKWGGFFGVDKYTATFAKVPAQTTLPSRHGYIFSGYYSEPNGEGVQYFNSNGVALREWDIPSNTTLYAYWVTLPVITTPPQTSTTPETTTLESTTTPTSTSTTPTSTTTTTVEITTTTEATTTPETTTTPTPTTTTLETTTTIPTSTAEQTTTLVTTTTAELTTTPVTTTTLEITTTAEATTTLETTTSATTTTLPITTTFETTTAPQETTTPLTTTTPPTTTAIHKHKWGEWGVTIYATLGKIGVETRICTERDCDGVEIRSFNDYRLGNVNGDGQIDIFDALEILKYLVNMDCSIVHGNISWRAAMIVTVNEEEPTIMDVLEILKYLVNMPSKLTVDLEIICMI